MLDSCIISSQYT